MKRMEYMGLFWSIMILLSHNVFQDHLGWEYCSDTLQGWGGPKKKSLPILSAHRTSAEQSSLALMQSHSLAKQNWDIVLLF